jgi:hypothetical protein
MIRISGIGIHLIVSRRPLVCHIDKLRGAPEPDHADKHAPLYPPDHGFSKKRVNHAAAVALHFAHHNLARIHKTLRMTPALAANVTDHLWTIEEFSN